MRLRAIWGLCPAVLGIPDWLGDLWMPGFETEWAIFKAICLDPLDVLDLPAVHSV